MASEVRRSLLDEGIDKLDAPVTPAESAVERQYELFRKQCNETGSDITKRTVENQIESWKKTSGALVQGREKLLLKIATYEAALKKLQDRLNEKSEAWLSKARQNAEEAHHTSKDAHEQQSEDGLGLPGTSGPQWTANGVPAANIAPLPTKLQFGITPAARNKTLGQRHLGRNGGRASGNSGAFTPNQRGRGAGGQQRGKIAGMQTGEGHTASNSRSTLNGLPRSKLGTPASVPTGLQSCTEVPKESFYSKSSEPGSGEGAGLGGPSRPTEGVRQSQAAEPRGRAAVTRQAAKDSQGPIEISSDEETEAVDARNTNGNATGEGGPRRSGRGNKYESLASKLEGLKALFPPEGGPDSIQILASDLAVLEPEEFLNDTIIDFFIKKIQVELEAERQTTGGANLFHFFNTFFFKKLTEKSGDAGNSLREKHFNNHDRVRKWTKGKDIFSRDYLFVPIHDHLHWSLVIVCFPASVVLGIDGDRKDQLPCILHLDSMEAGGHNHTPLAAALRGYLQEEWRRQVEEPGSVARKWREENPDAPLPSFTPQNMPCKKIAHLPKQDNYCDCGLFTLTYIHFFTHGPPHSFKLGLNGLSKMGEDHEYYPLFLTREWFSKGNAGRLRGLLRYLVLDLFAQQAPNRESEAAVLAVSGREEYKELCNADPSVRYQSPSDSLRDNHNRRAEQKKRKAERQMQTAENKRLKTLEDAEHGALRKANSERRRSENARKGQGTLQLEPLPRSKAENGSKGRAQEVETVLDSDEEKYSSPCLKGPPDSPFPDWFPAVAEEPRTRAGKAKQATLFGPEHTDVKVEDLGWEDEHKHLQSMFKLRMRTAGDQVTYLVVHRQKRKGEEVLEKRFVRPEDAVGYMSKLYDLAEKGSGNNSDDPTIIDPETEQKPPPKKRLKKLVPDDNGMSEGADSEGAPTSERDSRVARRFSTHLVDQLRAQKLQQACQDSATDCSTQAAAPGGKKEKREYGPAEASGGAEGQERGGGLGGEPKTFKKSWEHTAEALANIAEYGSPQSSALGHATAAVEVPTAAAEAEEVHSQPLPPSQEGVVTDWSQYLQPPSQSAPEAVRKADALCNGVPFAIESPSSSPPASPSRVQDAGRTPAAALQAIEGTDSAAADGSQVSSEVEIVAPKPEVERGAEEVAQPVLEKGKAKTFQRNFRDKYNRHNKTTQQAGDRLEDDSPAVGRKFGDLSLNMRPT